METQGNSAEQYLDLFSQLDIVEEMDKFGFFFFLVREVSLVLVKPYNPVFFPSENVFEVCSLQWNLCLGGDCQVYDPNSSRFFVIWCIGPLRRLNSIYEEKWIDDVSLSLAGCCSYQTKFSTKDLSLTYHQPRP